MLYLGLNKRYEHLAHHDFVFSRDPHEEFDFIYKKGEPAPDPTCYLAATTCTEPGTAPAGGEALYVLVHTPYLRPHHDWKKMLPAYRRVILEKLKRTGHMPDIEERIVFERTLTPQDIHDRYHVLNGAIYGLASHGSFLGAFKPGNRCPDLRGLYLAGGAAHPGPGMPMVLMCGWIAADALDRDTRCADDNAAARTGDGRMKTAARARRSRRDVSAGVLKVFAAYSRRYVRRHFHAAPHFEKRTAAADCARPLVIYLNHASWWDPLVCLLLAREFFRERTSFAPIDAAMLERYGFFKHLGFFGVEQTVAARRAAVSCAARARILASSQNAVGSRRKAASWTCASARSVCKRASALWPRASRTPLFVPLAIEYAFWTEPRPEILVSFGEPIVPRSKPRAQLPTIGRGTFTDALETTQDELATRSCRRDATEWRTLQRGKFGVGGIYDAWRRLRARVRGERFVPEHQTETTR